MSIKFKKLTLAETLSLFSLILFLLISLLNTTFYARYISGVIYNVGILTSVILLIIKELINNKLNFQRAISLLGVIIVYALVGSVTGFLSTLAISIIFIFSLRDISFKYVARTSFYISLFILIFVVLSSQIGLISNYIEFSGGRIRQYLGFRYSLFPSTVMLNIIASSFFLTQDKVSYKRLFFLLVSTIWIFFQTDSRLTFISSLLLLGINLVVKWYPSVLKSSALLLKTFKLTYIVNAYLSYLIAKMYLSFSSPFLNELSKNINQFLGGRNYYANRSLNIYGYKLFGQKINWIGNGLDINGQRGLSEYLYVDNLYIQILQRYGLFVLLILLLIFTLTLHYLLKQKQYVLSLILIILSFHAMIDDLIINLHYNIFLILIGTLMNQTQSAFESNLQLDNGEK